MEPEDSRVFLAKQQPLAIDDLATDDLQHLASAHGTQCTWQHDRSSVLSLVTDAVVRGRQKVYVVEDAKGVSPGRMLGKMLSYNSELYMYGGLTARQFLTRDIDFGSFYKGKEHFMMKLDRDTHSWEPISYQGAARDTWQKIHASSRGKFYLTSTSTRDEDEDDMRIYDFTKKEWEMLTFGLRPEAAINSFVTVSGDQLVQYGGMILSQEYVETNAALWTFDIKQRMWQQRQAAGTLPEPKFTCGLAAANDKVYLLSNTDNMEGEMMVFELDLQTWQCQLLPSIGEAPPCLAGMSLVVAEDEWLVYGGKICCTRRWNSLYSFDFKTLSWSKAELIGDPWHPRHEGMAAYHDGALVAMGGLYVKLLSTGQTKLLPMENIQTFRQRPAPRQKDEPATITKLDQYGLSSRLKEKFRSKLMTDATIVVGTRSWGVHRADLASESPIFKSAFESEANQGIGCTLNMVDITEGTMHLLLEWIYGGLEDRPSLPETVSLFQAAHKFDMPVLQHQLEQVMESHINLQTYPQLAELAYQHYASVLGQACERFATLLDPEGLDALEHSMSQYSAAQGRQRPMPQAEQSAPPSQSADDALIDAWHAVAGTLPPNSSADDVRNHAEDGEDKEHDEVNPAQAVSTMAALVSTKDKAALNVEAMEALERQRDKSILAQVDLQLVPQAQQCASPPQSTGGTNADTLPPNSSADDAQDNAEDSQNGEHEDLVSPTRVMSDMPATVSTQTKGAGSLARLVPRSASPREQQATSAPSASQVTSPNIEIDEEHKAGAAGACGSRSDVNRGVDNGQAESFSLEAAQEVQIGESGEARHAESPTEEAALHAQDGIAAQATSGSTGLQQPEPQLGIVGDMVCSGVALLAVAGISTVAAAKKLSRFPRLW